MLNKVKFFVYLFFLSVIYAVLYKILIPRISAFGCFDDCSHFVAGYFILKGKVLYSQVYQNHHPLANYISYLIQFFTEPINIFELVLRHRQFLMLFGFSSSLLIVWRFGLAGVGFAFIYEFTKYYIFGDRFLGEGFIVYPIAYMFGLIWLKAQNKKLLLFDYLLSSVMTWFIIFIRATFNPLAVVMYGLILWKRPFQKRNILSLLLFLGLVIVMLVSLPLREYYFNLVTVNAKTVAKEETLNVFKSFFYPVYIFLQGEMNLFRHFLIALSSVFLILTGTLLRMRHTKLVFTLLLLLGLANLRTVEPGDVFYGAFHLVPWYGMFIFAILLMLSKIRSFHKKLFYLLAITLIGAFFYTTLSVKSYIREDFDSHAAYINNYGNYLQVGNVVKILSDPGDTLFLDGFDDLIYWQSNRLSPYKYSWYTSVMNSFDKYRTARIEMFDNNPPDFYYGQCPDERIVFGGLPDSIKSDYQQFVNNEGNPTCLYVRKDKIPDISEEKWLKAKEFLYELPQS